MSFLTAPTPGKHSFPAQWTPGVAGLLSLSEIAPMGGAFRPPADWPPSGGLSFGNEGITPNLGGLGASRAEAARIHAAAARGAAMQRRAAVMAARAGGGGLRRPPQVPGASRRGGSVGQGAYLAPGQLPQADTTPLTVADELQRFSMDGLGMSASSQARMFALQQQAAAIAQQYAKPYQAPSTAKGSAYEGGARMYVDPTEQLQTAYIEGKINLEPICDASGKNCIQYVDPAEVEKAIGAKIGGQSALRSVQAELPSFYAHPQLGPYGVDPNQAYQYWAAQQASMQASPYGTLMPGAMSIFGSPGMSVAPPQGYQAAPGASASFAPSPGSTSERF